MASTTIMWLDPMASEMGVSKKPSIVISICDLGTRPVSKEVFQEQSESQDYLELNDPTKDMVINTAELFSGQEVGGRRSRSAECLISRCTREQVSRYGQRPVPIHVAGMGEIHSHIHPPVALSRKQMLRKLDPQPRCQKYEVWIAQKEKEFENLVDNLALRDLKCMHKFYGHSDIASYFNSQIREKREEEKKTEKKKPKSIPWPKRVSKQQMAVDFWWDLVQALMMSR